MIRAFLAGLCLAVFALFVLLFFSVPGFSAGLHPDCNVTMPCAPMASAKPASSREARLIARADRFRNVEFGAPMYPPETARSFLGKSSGLVAPLAAKLTSIQAACPGTVAISGVRHTYIAGTRRISLHASGKAVDVRGPYSCIYAQLRGWVGGYSTDAGRVQHIHISYDADGGREMGLAFRHGVHRHARRIHRHRYATAQ